MNTELLSLIGFIVYTLLFCLVAFGYSRSLINNKSIRNQLAAEVIEKAALTARIDQLEGARDSDKIENTEGFLRFVSESREWAFEYIEDVQQALLAYDIALSTDDAKIINDAYKKLISFLPDDDVVS
jgi:hypothetical protein